MTEAQAFSVWTPPGGALGALTDEARARAATLSAGTAELERLAAGASAAPSLRRALRRGDVAIIAEVKRSSPSRGSINPDMDVPSQVRSYETGGAAAISVLTEPTRFGGSNDDLVTARTVVGLPLLKKDFHVEPAQILEAKAIGASAALVIVRAVPPAKLEQLMRAAQSVALELLVEVRDERELQLALSLGATMVGINNRNLETLEIDSSTALRLLPLVPSGVIAVAESGFKTAADVERVADLGADAVLIGSELSGSSGPRAALKALTGVTRRDDARAS
ncbi:MAG TPA: indole-3-glycerol phosphate synthase TrpC [Gemmatimonadaceae bacterium]|nr:indole-3-glycerol phosphate synthase TrpC [Gemmatimonadaceae bacterium]